MWPRAEHVGGHESHRNRHDAAIQEVDIVLADI